MTHRPFLAANGPAILVEIAATKGSTPRETDAFMLVSRDALWGTIGGGQLEYLAIDHARRLLDTRSGASLLDIPLGPEIGQCCGGRVEISFARAEGETLAALKRRIEDDAARYPEVWLFGAGHVGTALAAALAPLPLRVIVVETRADELKGLPQGVFPRLSALPEALIGGIRPASAVVVLTHDHALDFLIAGAALRRRDLAYVGMIGSKTKRATFAGWARRDGLAEADIGRLVLPIGGASVRDKRPAVIAAMVAAELLTVLWQAGHAASEPAEARDTGT
ncbi:xanthine dehydrogenase accessory protein XdhC [Ensifer soli]|uniref:xanthine dehydrogenase accessory protein XdhC n=1 Tax=Ciceribacter sp. sgz301302 TaxID=3342379 RepID=UPI0035BAF0C3